MREIKLLHVLRSAARYTSAYWRLTSGTLLFSALKRATTMELSTEAIERVGMSLRSF